MLWILLACASDRPTTLPGVDAPLTVELVNPTTCSFCDPFVGLDTLRVDVLVDGGVVSSEAFDYPGDEVVLPDLADFGVVRIRLVGLSGGEVRSVGRTLEIALQPETSLTVPMLFLPANTTIPLGANMTADRSRHAAFRRRDGTVLLLGGVNPDRDGTFSSGEVFDPATWSFQVYGGGNLPAGVGAPRWSWAATDEVLLVGGFVTSPSDDDVPSATTAVWSQADDQIRPGPGLNTPRDGHCFSMYRGRLGIVFGGTADSNAGELAKLSDNTGDWELVNVPMRDFDQTLVSTCATLPDSSVFLVGDTAASTGTWSYDEGDTDAGEGFRPIDLLGEGADRQVDGPLAVAVGERVWIAGGADVAGGQAVDDGRWFDPARNGFLPAPSLAEARFDPSVDAWIEPGWVVVGGGWADTGHTRAVSSVELVAPEADLAGPLVPADRDRNGLIVTTLLDGTVLVTGGYDAGDDGVIDAALVLPWVE